MGPALLRVGATSMLESSLALDMDALLLMLMLALSVSRVTERRRVRAADAGASLSGMARLPGCSAGRRSFVTSRDCGAMFMDVAEASLLTARLRIVPARDCIAAADGGERAEPASCAGGARDSMDCVESPAGYAATVCCVSPRYPRSSTRPRGGPAAAAGLLRLCGGAEAKYAASISALGGAAFRAAPDLGMAAAASLLGMAK
mmetsp:Transcript_11396/g.35405  ORF Transcript_11396/g.35405 Transcript_11396/m.35405 type:complete len:203 (-) Transcript_11396:392-1000(-)